MESGKLEIMDLTKVSLSFPPTPKFEIDRPNILELITDVFEAGNNIVLIEGDDGIGKTNILKQFVERNAERAFSIFIKVTDKWGYDPYGIKQDLTNQLSWTLLKDNKIDEILDDSLYTKYIYDLRRKAKKGKDIYYFVLDGLTDIPEEYNDYLIEILNLLPISMNEYKFLLSGDSSQLPSEFQKINKFKTIILPSLSLDETKRYFDQLNIDEIKITEIYQLCKGIPGYLESVRRIIDDIGIETFWDEWPKSLPDVLEIEWKNVNFDNEKLVLTLTLICLDMRLYTAKNISDIINYPEDELINDLLSLNFITIDEKTKYVSFASDLFRKYAAKELSKYKRTINELKIEYLINRSETKSAFSDLPILYKEANKLEELIEYLSPDRLDRMLQEYKSLYPLKQKAILGVESATKLNKFEDILRFGMQISALEEIDKSSTMNSKIEAYIALNRISDAIELAHDAVLKEDRFLLLSLIAKELTTSGKPIEDFLIDEIRELYNDFDQNAMTSKTIEIASSLLFSIPELAINIIENYRSTHKREHEVDWAIAKLSIDACCAGKCNDSGRDSISDLKDRIKDPKLKEFADAMSLLLGGYDANKVISEADKISKPSDRILLFRVWALNNYDNPESNKVIKHALKLIVKYTEVSPTAAVLKDIATPLPNITSKDDLNYLVGRFDSLKETSERLGPNQDFVKLQLLISEAEATFNFDAFENRMIETYFFIDDIDDILIKAECLSELILISEKVDLKSVLERKHKLLSTIDADLEPIIYKLLKYTANHFDSMKNIIGTLSQYRPEDAIKFAMALNTEDRRDVALYHFIKSRLSINNKILDLSYIEEALDKMNDVRIYEEGIVEIIKQINVMKKSIEDFNKIKSIINRVLQIKSSIDRCFAICEAIEAYNFLSKGTEDSYIENLVNKLLYSWQIIDPDWRKVDIGYRIIINPAI